MSKFYLETIGIRGKPKIQSVSSEALKIAIYPDKFEEDFCEFPIYMELTNLEKQAELKIRGFEGLSIFLNGKKIQ